MALKCGSLPRDAGDLAGLRLLSFKRPLLSVDVSMCLCVCLFVRDLMLKYIGN